MRISGRLRYKNSAAATFNKMSRADVRHDLRARKDLSMEFIFNPMKFPGVRVHLHLDYVKMICTIRRQSSVAAVQQEYRGAESSHANKEHVHTNTLKSSCRHTGALRTGDKRWLRSAVSKSKKIKPLDAQHDL